jgi:hypothetical protein
MSCFGELQGANHSHSHRYLHNSPAQKLTSSRFEVQEFVGATVVKLVVANIDSFRRFFLRSFAPCFELNLG